MKTLSFLCIGQLDTKRHNTGQLQYSVTASGLAFIGLPMILCFLLETVRLCHAHPTKLAAENMPQMFPTENLDTTNMGSRGRRTTQQFLTPLGRSARSDDFVATRSTTTTSAFSSIQTIVRTRSHFNVKPARKHRIHGVRFNQPSRSNRRRHKDLVAPSEWRLIPHDSQRMQNKAGLAHTGNDQDGLQNKEVNFSRQQTQTLPWNYPWLYSSKENSANIENEILEFLYTSVIQMKINFDVNQAYWLIMEWEKHQRFLDSIRRREHEVRVIQQPRLLQKQHLIHQAVTASEESPESARERALQIGRARDFTEFKHLLFQGTEWKVNQLAMGLVSAPVKYPSLSHAPIGPVSKIHLPGMTGGGIMVRLPRHGRDVSRTRVQKRTGNPRSGRKQSPGSGCAVQGNCDSLTMHKERKVNQGRQERSMEQLENSYSEDEARSAYESHLLFRQNACRPMNSTVCTLKLLGMMDQPGCLAYPRLFYVPRCGNTQNNHDNYFMSPTATIDQDSSHHTETLHSGTGTVRSCNCEDPLDECIPTNVSVKMQPIIVIESKDGSTQTPYTKVIGLTEHHSCECLPRCINRLCVSPLQFEASTTANCSCTCPLNDLRCFNLLEGTEQFSPYELPLPLNGSYILPPCQYGPMDPIHLYHRRCPRPVPRVLAALLHR